MGIEKGIFKRAELLMGSDVMDVIAQKNVIVFGVGGVGSWCAECLVRSGIRRITIVDSDRVCITNINRQLMATTKTVGQVKVEALKSRLLEINPNAEVTALQKIYSAETADDFILRRSRFLIVRLGRGCALVVRVGRDSFSRQLDGRRVDDQISAHCSLACPRAGMKKAFPLALAVSHCPSWAGMRAGGTGRERFIFSTA